MQLKFITLNIEHGGKLMDNILSFLNNEMPDILFLQEVYNSADQSLERRFRTIEVFSKEFSSLLPYSDFKGIAYDPVIKAEMGNAIFSKFPIIDSGITFFDVPYGNVNFTGEHDPPTVPRAIQYAKARFDNFELNFFNLHGIWAKYGGDDSRRIEMANTISGLLKEKENIILAGDTNFTPEAKKTTEIIESGGVKSVFGNSLRSTFNMKYKTIPGYATAAVDMVFLSNNIGVVESEMPEVDVSDHYPLKVILEL